MKLLRSVSHMAPARIAAELLGRSGGHASACLSRGPPLALERSPTRIQEVPDRSEKKGAGGRFSGGITRRKEPSP